MRDAEPLPHGALFWIAVAVAFYLIVFAFWAFADVRTAKAQDYPNCRGFIDKTCCCTSSCCRSIKSTEIEPDGDGYRVVATGRRVETVRWSEDGDLILCDCNGSSRAYCLYLPLPNS